MDKKIFIFVFIIFHLASIVIWNLNHEINFPNEIINLISPYMYSLSLWQSWNIFSPDPYTRETTTRIVIERNNETDYYFTDHNPFIFTRFRKFNDNVVGSKNPVLNTPYLIYLCKEFSKIYEPEYDITLQIMYKEISFQKSDEKAICYDTLGDITCG